MMFFIKCDRIRCIIRERCSVVLKEVSWDVTWLILLLISVIACGSLLVCGCSGAQSAHQRAHNEIVCAQSVFEFMNTQTKLLFINQPQ